MLHLGHIHHHCTAPGEGICCRTSPSGDARLSPLQGGGAQQYTLTRSCTTVEPSEVAALAAEPPEVSVVSSCELSPCPVMAMEAACELSSCHVTARKAVCELSPCPVMAMEAVCELSSCPAKSRLWRPPVIPRPALSWLRRTPRISSQALPRPLTP